MPSGDRSGFGSLIGPVQPLPDDEPDERPTAPPARARRPRPSSSSAGAAPTSGPLADLPAAPRRTQPPGTIRLDERAAGELWTSYQDALKLQPGLSYRAFASHVVRRGLQP